MKKYLLAGLCAMALTGWASAQSDHLIITEVLVDCPNEGAGGFLLESNVSSAEYIEIYNPTSTAVNLHNYFISDLSNDQDREYYRLPTAPVDTADNLRRFPEISGADFLYQFPAGSQLQPGQTAVVTQSARRFLYHFFNGSPTAPEKTIDNVHENLPLYTGQENSPLLFEVSNDLNTEGIAQGAAPVSGVPKMISRAKNVDPTRDWNLSFTNPSATAGEHVVLFHWDGLTDLVQDCDIVQWGTPNGAADRLKLKNGKQNNLSTYKNENGDVSATGNLRASTSNHPVFFRISRLEPDEVATDGNGITGHDETTEVNAQSWSSGGTGGATGWNAYSVISPGLFDATAKVNSWDIY